MPDHHPNENDARAERQMALCCRLAAVATQMAEAAAAAALAEYAAGKPVSENANLFIKFSHAARQAILLENRIAEGPRAPAIAKPAPPSEPRAPGSGTAVPSERLQIERLDTGLALNPNATPDEILAVLCGTVGLPMDSAAVEPPPDQDNDDSIPFYLRKNPEPSLLARIGLETTRRT